MSRQPAIDDPITVFLHQPAWDGIITNVFQGLSIEVTGAPYPQGLHILCDPVARDIVRSDLDDDDEWLDLETLVWNERTGRWNIF